MFTLIIILYTNLGTIEQVKFSSIARCEAAKVIVLNAPTSQYTNRITTAMCVVN